MREISSGAVVFVIPMLICIATLTAFPKIATFLPTFVLSR
jgi:TRAP-type C4-dicarboxylate transport system permease large subunit